MSIIEFTSEDLEKWSEKIGAYLHLIYADVLCIEYHLSFFKERSLPEKKYVSIFNHFHRLFWDSLYLKIYKLLDQRREVLSLPNFFIKCGQKEILEELKKNVVVKKIRAKRSSKIAHSSLKLALNHSADSLFYEQNKLNLSDIHSLLKTVQSKFEQVLSEKGFPILHYALGKCNESSEFKKLLLKAFDI